MSETTTPQDRLPAAEEAFAERVAPLMELVERWRARIGTEAGSWPTVPLSELDPDDPRRLAAEIAEGAPGHGSGAVPSVYLPPVSTTSPVTARRISV